MAYIFRKLSDIAVANAKGQNIKDTCSGIDHLQLTVHKLHYLYSFLK